MQRGVSNVVLMLIVAVAMVVLLVGGYGLVVNLIQAQAKASPEFVATELTTLINTVQAAPETVTFEYYTETGLDGYPVIGSLEIDDDKSELCVHPKTEDELFGSITESAAIGAGFGGMGYAYNKYRSMVAKTAAQRALADEATFEPILKDLNPKTRYALGADTQESSLLRKYTAGEKLTKKEGLALQKTFKKKPFLKPDLHLQRSLILKGQNQEFKKILQATKKTSLSKSISAKIPFTTAQKTSKSALRFMGYAQRTGEAKLSTRVGAGIKSVIKSPIKVGAGVSAGAKSGALKGGLIAAQYLLSGGDWEQTAILTAQLTIMAYAPKYMEKFLLKKSITFKFITKSLAFKNPVNIVFERLKAALAKTPPPATPVGIAAAYAVHAGMSALNLIWSIWDTITFDVFLAKIYDAAGDGVAKERNLIACKTFTAPKKVLLTPPNCNPEVGFKDKSVFEKWDTPRPELVGISPIEALSAATTTAFAAGIPIAISSAVIAPGGISQEAGANFLTVENAVQIGLASTTIGIIVGTLAPDPTAIIPTSSCSQSCDKTYSRQDCPNWFVTDNGGGAALAGGTFVGVMQGGPACAALSWAGWASLSCDGFRIFAALTTFLDRPADVFNFMLQGYKVGFNKQSVSSKTAPEFPELGQEFADNKGYWYAELPFVIELSKVYTNATTLEKRNPPLVIRKV